MRFTIAGSRVPTIDRDRLNQPAKGAESGPGLVVCNASGDLAPPAAAHHSNR